MAEKRSMLEENGASEEPGSDIAAERDDASRRWVAPRPLGISILCVLHGVGGLILGYVVLTMLLKPGNQADIQRPLEMAGAGYAQLIISMVLMTITGLGSAVGMCIGRKWGWWLGAFYYANSLVRYSNAIFVAWTFSKHEPLDFDPARIYSRYAIRMGVNSLILLYLFRINVLEYFGLEHHSRLRLLSELVGANVAITVLMAFL